MAKKQDSSSKQKPIKHSPVEPKVLTAEGWWREQSKKRGKQLRPEPPTPEQA